MILLNATDISKSYTVNPLLSNLSYAINEGDKIGLIGVNGTGKSTLLRITAGAEEPDSGKIVLTGGVRIGYLMQAPDYDPEQTVLEAAVSYLRPEVLAEPETCRNGCEGLRIFYISVLLKKSILFAY